MKSISRLAATTAALIVAATAVSSSAFADSRNRDETDRRDTSAYENRDRDRRDDERVTVEGLIQNITRERDGYRVQLERSAYSFWVPEREFRSHNFNIGVSIRLGGIFRRGAVYVDAIDYPVQRVYVRGRVTDVDYRRGLILVKDEFSRRVITVDAYRLDNRSRRFDIDDIRRGDSVEVWGDWGRHGVLEAYRFEERGGRWR